MTQILLTHMAEHVYTPVWSGGGQHDVGGKLLSDEVVVSMALKVRFGWTGQQVRSVEL